jgi:hypothetical protein
LSSPLKEEQNFANNTQLTKFQINTKPSQNSQNHTGNDYFTDQQNVLETQYSAENTPITNTNMNILISQESMETTRTISTTPMKQERTLEQVHEIRKSLTNLHNPRYRRPNS